jgi:RNA polymerase sigma-70 factor (ECF subfamily)
LTTSFDKEAMECILTKGMTVEQREVQDDQDLVRRAQAGDREAIGDLFVLHSQAVRRLLRSVIGPNADLDDLTQEVFLRAHRSLHGFKGKSRFATWLHRLTVNTAISHLRKMKNKNVLMDPAVLEVVAGDDSASVHESAIGREMVRRLYKILNTVSHKRRAAFTLFEIEGRSLASMAEILGISRASAKSRVWFARREISRKAGDDPYLGPLLAERKQ